LAQAGHIDLVFSDEAGFSLNLNVPYGWRFPHEAIAVLPQRGQQVNVLGFMDWQGRRVRTFQKQGSVTAEFVHQAITTWWGELTGQHPAKPMVLVLDNARLHHGQLMKASLAGWQAQGLYVFYLPAYSPHLNRIERLWLKTKQRWLKPSDYADLVSLKAALARIWAEFGETYTVNFN